MRALAAIAFTFSTLAGSPGTVVNSQDGNGAGAQFDAPRGIAVNSAGVITVADYGSHTIRAIATNGSTVTVAGVVGSPGTTDGSSTAARFHFPSGVALTTAGVIYVADTDNDTIRKVTADGAVTAQGLTGRVYCIHVRRHAQCLVGTNRSAHPGHGSPSRPGGSAVAPKPE